MREAIEVGGDDEVGRVLVAVEEVHRAADVEDAGSVAHRFLRRRVTGGKEHAPQRLHHRHAALGMLRIPAREARGEGDDRALPHLGRRREALAEEAVGEPLPHALTRHAYVRRSRLAHQRLDRDRAPDDRIAALAAEARCPLALLQAAGSEAARDGARGLPREDVAVNTRDGIAVGAGVKLAAEPKQHL